MIARGLFTRVTDGAGEFIGVNPPYRMSGTPAELRSPVPQKGEHNAATLRNMLGIDERELERLTAAGVLGS